MANPSENGSNNNYVYQPGYGHDGGSLVTEYNPGVSVDWTPDEQSILEDGFSQYASETNIVRYAKIAVQLQNKTVRDVAMRCRWMVERMNEDLAGKPSSYSQGVVANGKSNALQYSVLVTPAGQLIEESARALNRVYTNLETNQVHENIRLLCQVRKNIHEILNNLIDTPEKQKQIPPLPVKMNEDLLDSLIMVKIKD